MYHIVRIIINFSVNQMEQAMLACILFALIEQLTYIYNGPFVSAFTEVWLIESHSFVCRTFKYSNRTVNSSVWIIECLMTG